eukprot:sb/3460677/
MLTLTQKAKQQKKPLYAIMVDFRKAFDSIPREALFLKLARMGITGNFYNILRDMYGKSSGRIKLSGHVSREFPIRKGTEQGHPLSEDSPVPLPLDYVPDTISSRVSQDQKRNKQGNHFKELVQNHQLRLLNGRTLGDFTGRFTSIQFAGCSVVDYIAISRSLTPRIDYMKVLDLLPTSDHRPLTTAINCRTAPIPKIYSLKGNYDVAPARFIVSDAGKESFKTLLAHPATKEALAPIEAMLEDPAKAYQHLTTHLQALCGLTFKKCCTSKPVLINKPPYFHFVPVDPVGRRYHLYRPLLSRILANRAVGTRSLLPPRLALCSAPDSAPFPNPERFYFFLLELRERSTSPHCVTPHLIFQFVLLLMLIWPTERQGKTSEAKPVNNLSLGLLDKLGSFTFGTPVWAIEVPEMKVFMVSDSQENNLQVPGTSDNHSPRSSTPEKKARVIPRRTATQRTIPRKNLSPAEISRKRRESYESRSSGGMFLGSDTKKQETKKRTQDSTTLQPGVHPWDKNNIQQISLAPGIFLNYTEALLNESDSLPPEDGVTLALNSPVVGPALSHFIGYTESYINECLTTDTHIKDITFHGQEFECCKTYKLTPSSAEDEENNPSLIFVCLAVGNQGIPLRIRKNNKSPVKHDMKVGDLVVVNGATSDVISWRVNPDKNHHGGRMIVMSATHSPTDINTVETARIYSESEPELTEAAADYQAGGNLSDTDGVIENPTLLFPESPRSFSLPPPQIIVAPPSEEPSEDRSTHSRTQKIYGRKSEVIISPVNRENPNIAKAQEPRPQQDPLMNLQANRPSAAISPVLGPTNPCISSDTHVTLCDATVVQKTEESMIELKSEIRDHKEVVMQLALLLPGKGSCRKCSPQEAKSSPEAKIDTSKWEEMESRLKIDLQSTEEKIAELINEANNMRELITNSSREWKTFLDSAFFRKDSELLKEIHKSVTAIEKSNPEIQPTARVPGVDRQQNPSRSTRNRQPAEFVPLRPRNATPRQGTTKTTALITNSILSSARPNTIGKGHQCHVIRRRSWRTVSTLKKAETLDELIQLQPESIYIHLGVNDVYRWNTQELENDPTEIANLARDFIGELEVSLPNAQVILSLPVLTADRSANRRIIDLKMESTLPRLELSYSKPTSGETFFAQRHGKMRESTSQIQLSKLIQKRKITTPIQTPKLTQRLTFQWITNKATNDGNLKETPQRDESMTSNGKPKYQDPDTMSLFSTHDIVCLQEIRQDVPVPNFTDHASVRLSKKTGGVGILIKDNLAEGLSIVETTNPDIIVGKLQKSFFGFDKDLYIVNTYARPENASGNHIKSGEETISDCDEIIANLPEGDVILCGDFNARVSGDPCQASESEDSPVPLPLDYVPDTISSRVSQDQKRNKQGNHFKELVQNHQLRLLNGRTLGDFTGRFTSIQFAGCSVVDYIAISRSLTPRIDYMKVLDLLPTSDHRPLTTAINCRTAPIPKIYSLKGNYDVAPARFIVSDAGKESFKTLLAHPATKEALAPIEAMLEDPAKAYQHLTTHLQALCGLTFKKSNPGKSPSQSSQPWHRKKHKVAKTMLERASKLVNRFTHGHILRENYYRIKGSYRRLKRNDESKHDAKLNSDIMNGKIMNWQAFSDLKNSKTHAVPHNALDMEKFGEFFKDLYANSHSTISDAQKFEMQAEADVINNQAENKTPIEDALRKLNSVVTLDETVKSIKQLKSGKAAGPDMISNEVLKLLDTEHQLMLTQVFNCCFKQGIYPWNASIITPLHKKGSTKNPDNYRAVSIV